jgi:hypothetical protein
VKRLVGDVGEVNPSLLPCLFDPVRPHHMQSCERAIEKGMLVRFPSSPDVVRLPSSCVHLASSFLSPDILR